HPQEHRAHAPPPRAQRLPRAPRQTSAPRPTRAGDEGRRMSSTDRRALEEEAKRLLGEARTVRDWSEEERAATKQAIERRLQEQPAASPARRLAIPALAALTAAAVILLFFRTADREDVSATAPVEHQRFAFGEGAVYRAVAKKDPSGRPIILELDR